MRRATDLLLDQPGVGFPVNPNLRKFILTRFPFALYYSVTTDVLRIEAVAHQRAVQDIGGHGSGGGEEEGVGILRIHCHCG